MLPLLLKAITIAPLSHLLEDGRITMNDVSEFYISMYCLMHKLNGFADVPNPYHHTVISKVEYKDCATWVIKGDILNIFVRHMTPIYDELVEIVID